MMRPIEVRGRLQNKLIYKARSMRAKANQLKRLSSAYNRYLELEEEIDAVRHGMNIIVGLLGPDQFAETITIDNTASLKEAVDGLRSPIEARERLTLWRAIREYLRVVGNAKVSDIHEFLEWMKLPDFTRQAVESAFQNHEDVFTITKKGRERYVTLK